MPRCVLPPIPRGGVFPFTGRSPGLASSAGTPSQRFFRQWLHRFLGTRSLVCFTVAGTAPVLHRLPMLAEHARVRRRASLRTCVGCSFVTDIIHADGALVNLLRFLDTFPAICYNSDGRNRSRGFHPFVCISFRTQGAIFLAPAACLPVTNPINKLRWGCEAVQRAIADFVRFHCPLVASAEAKLSATKKLTTKKAPFPKRRKQRPCSARLAEPSPP